MRSDEKSKIIILIQQILEDSRRRAEESETRAQEERRRADELGGKFDSLLSSMNKLLASNRIKDNRLAETDPLIAELKKALSYADCITKKK